MTPPEDFSQLLADKHLGRQAVGLAADLELLWPGIEEPLYEEPTLVVAYSNGRLPKTAVRAIQGGYLSKEAAPRWTAMRDHIGRKHGVWIVPTGPNSSYRTYAAQQYFWDLYQSGRGNVAAHPGTSNHGWGNAVDVATPTMAYYIRKYGHLFGWSHAEGARVGEWWHFTYIGGGRTNVAPNPLAKLEPDERKHVELLTHWRTVMRKEAVTGEGPNWRKAKSRAQDQKDWLIARRDRLDHLRKTRPEKENRKRRRGTRRKILAQVIAGKPIKL